MLLYTQMKQVHTCTLQLFLLQKNKKGDQITKTTLKDIRTEVEKAFIEEYNKVFNTNKELKKGCEIEEHLQVKDYKNTKKVLEVAKKTADKQVLKEKIEKDYKKLDDEVKEKEKENNFLTNQLTKLEREKTEKKQDLEKIKKDIENIDNIREELNNQYQDIEKLKANKDSNNSIIEMYKNNAVETREKIDNLKKEFNRLEDERLEKEKENQEQKERIRNTQEAILKDLENAEKIKEERKKRLEELEKENKELNNKIEEQENTLRKLQSKSEELEEKIKKLKTDEDTIMSKISNNSDKNEVDEVDIASLIDKLDNYELVKEYDLYNTLPPFQIFTDELIYDSETGEGNSELAKNLIISAKGEEFWDNMNLKDIREWGKLKEIDDDIIILYVKKDKNGENL